MTVLSLMAIAMAAPVARAEPVAADSFDYAAGGLKGENGGSGAWSGAWGGDNQPIVIVPGTLTYTDLLGNTLMAAGGHVGSTASSTKNAERNLSSTWGSGGTTVWLSALIEGAAGSQKTNISLGDKFFVGQGNGSVSQANWTIYDQGGLKYNSGVAAGDNQDFLVVQIDFKAGVETAWLWINPNLDATPVKSAASNGASGTSIADFTFNQVGLYFSQSNDGFIDELRLATTYAEVAPHAAPLNDTVVTAPASLNLGGMLVGYDPAAVNVDLNKTGLRATTYSAASSAGLTVTADGSIAEGSQTETLAIDLTTAPAGSGVSGSKTLSVTIDNLAATSAASGQGSDDAADTIAVTAQVYQAAAVSANTGKLGDGGLATVTNAASSDNGALGQRASAVLESYQVSGDGWSVAGLTSGVTQTGVVTTTAQAFSGTVQFDATGQLNGSHKGTLTMQVATDPALLGADLLSATQLVWSLQEVVTGNTGHLSSVVAADIDLGDLEEKLSSISDKSRGTVVTLLDGIFSSQRTVQTIWRDADANDIALISDVLTLGDTNGDVYVMQLSYDDSLLGGDLQERTLASAGGLRMAWKNGSGLWVNPVDGNFGAGNTPLFRGLGAYDAAEDFTLGYWGVDTDANVVWAVLDHNSEFAVSAIPEPTTLAFILAGGLLALLRRR
ncbi:MAG: PEP-CTERM sorting domain-containing protein [Planctomycetaceae bacterium]|nr:PEP-CTERM sorting domain-containing protein [Planctomycetaceae bacterium]